MKLFFLFFVIGLYACALAETSPYGICAHLQRWEYDRADEELTMMQAAGINSVRFDLDWKILEREPGKWDFQKFDSLFQMAGGQHVEVLPILGYETAWANPAHRHLPEFLNYVETVIKRYGKNTPYVEIWNEQNHANSWPGKPNGAEYASLLTAVSQKIKEINPKIKVVYGGTAGIPAGYLEDSFKAGAAQAADIIAVHPYRWSEVPESTLASDIVSLRALMTRYGAGDKPIWFTEMGYSTVERIPFLPRLLPRLLAAMEMTPAETTCIVLQDQQYLYYTENPMFEIKELMPEVKAIKGIALPDLKTLPAAPDTLLVLPENETFPAIFLPDLTDYLRRGGRVLSPGGLPFYFDLRREDDGRISKIQVNDRYIKELHLNWYTFWTRPGTPKSVNNFEFPAGDTGQPLPFLNGFRFFDDRNLASGDRLQPVLWGRQGDFCGIMAGVYHLDSDLKGKIAVCGNLANRNEGTSSRNQAELLARTMLISFAAGVERIYWYSLRSTEKDQFDREAYFGIIRKNLSPQPAYYAYKTLTAMFPPGSTALQITRRGVLHFANWRKPDGIPVSAVWTAQGNQPITIRLSGTLTCATDLLGQKQEMQPDASNCLSIKAGPGILYLENITGLELINP